MKILFLVENYYPKISGVPVVVKYLAEGLLMRGHKVSLATPSVEGYPKEEQVNGIHVYRFDIWKTFWKRYAGEIDRYREFVIGFGADAVIFECTECVTTDVLLHDLDRIKGKKILHAHGFNGICLKPFKRSTNLKYTLGNTYNWARFKWYYGYYLKRFIKGFDETLCLSDVDSSKVWLERYARNVTVLQNAVDDMFCEPTKPVAQEEILSLGKPYYVSVAGYGKVKNQVGIVQEYFKTKTDAALVLVGTWETEYYHNILQEIERQTRLHGKRNVLTFAGVPRSTIPDIIGNAAIYLVGSLWEAYSISLIEAQCKGIPFISTNVGNARIMPGGITLRAMSDMHEEIDRLMDDKGLWQTLSRQGKAFVQENCRIDKAVGLLESIIKN